MLFNSLHFLIFLPLVVALYYLLPEKRRWVLLFIASCYFYMVFVPEYILVLFFLILVDYVSGIAIEKSLGRKRLLCLVLSLGSNILLLGFFKYFNFLNQNLVVFFSFFGKHFDPYNLNVLLPIGLSFHTFQSMSYTIEVYRGNQKAERHLGYFANYVLFFPQMVAGPIERYGSLGNELKTPHPPRYKNFSEGFRLILFGLFIKMTIADNIAPYVNLIYDQPRVHNALEVWWAVVLFSFQIYADFFGYSTIALGAARLLGITIMDNFNTPYFSRSISEFWTRWHISLSTWFRDYVYIPLGGNKVSLPRWSLNILIVFLISGLWHGASWTFVVWGVLHGLLRLSEKYFCNLFNFRIKEGWGIVNILLCLKTFILTSLIWVFFRAENFGKAKEVFNALFGNWNLPFQANGLFVPMASLTAMLLADTFTYGTRFDERLSHFTPLRRWVIYSLLVFALFALSGVQKFSFIYFQF